MPEEARGMSQDFWRPAQAPRIGVESVFPAECCVNCGTEFSFGARFCHVCGSSRGPLPAPRSRLSHWVDPSRVLLAVQGLRAKLNLGLPSFILLLLAAACALAAMLTGLFYHATTVLEWEAVQIWRLEWMLGAVVALLAALLLRDALP